MPEEELRRLTVEQFLDLMPKTLASLSDEICRKFVSNGGLRSLDGGMQRTTIKFRIGPKKVRISLLMMEDEHAPP